MNDDAVRELSAKARIIQESVPGKQISLAHIIANPDEELLKKLSVKTPPGENSAIGILTVTPGEAAIIAGDIAIKASGVKIAVMDITEGTLVFYGTVSQAEAALSAITEYTDTRLGFSVCDITKT